MAPATGRTHRRWLLPPSCIHLGSLARFRGAPTTPLPQAQTAATPARAPTLELVSPQSALSWDRGPVSPPWNPIPWGNFFPAKFSAKVRAATPNFAPKSREGSQAGLPTFGPQVLATTAPARNSPDPPKVRRSPRPGLPTPAPTRLGNSASGQELPTPRSSEELPTGFANILFRSVPASKSLMTHASS